MFRFPDQTTTLDTIEKLAKGLETTPEYLAYGIEGGEFEADARQTVYLPIIGEVAAGWWLDMDDVADETSYDEFPIPFDDRYPQQAQYGLVVRGTSINRVVPEGAILKCIDIGISGMSYQDDDLVIVERTRGVDRVQKEVTAKFFRKRGNIIELSPDSNDIKWGKRWEKPFIYDEKNSPDDETLTIIAIVDGYYAPLRPLRRSL